MTVEDLQHFANSRRPVIALVHWPDGEDSHYLIVRGVSRGTVYFHDPIDGPSKASVRDFEAAWKASGRVGAYRRWGIAPWVS
jgi:predicted double-glycine peptidase